MKKLNAIKKLVAIAFMALVIPSSYLKAQYQVRWVVPDKIVNTSIANPTVTALPTSSSSSAVANGLFNASGTLIFYVMDNTIYNASGTVLSTFSVGTVWAEINVCRVPTTTDRYYVIYEEATSMSWARLFYTMIQVTGTTPSVVAGQQNIVFNTGHLYWLQPAIAVSGDLDINNGVNNKRYLYAAGGHGVDKYIVGSSGITFSQNIYSTPNVNGIHSVLELSHDGTKLAYGDPANWWVLNIMSLDGCGNFSSIASTTFATGPINGIEFNEAGDKCYVAAGNSFNSGNIYKVVSGVITLINNTAGYGGSDIELASNGKMYAAMSNGLGELNPATDVFTANKVLFTVKTGPPTYYTLPDQVDFNFGIAGKNAGWGPCCGTPPVLGTTNFGGCSYSWTPATGLSCTTCANPSATPSMTTTYTLTRTCGACVVIDKVAVSALPGCCRIGEVDETAGAEIDVFPNPNSGVFTLTGLHEDGTIEIYDQLGRKIFFEAVNGEATMDLNLQKLDRGIYIVKYSYGNSDQYKKFVRE